MISVLILTLNEEANLSACLDSVRWSDDIVVLDSGSSDRTVSIAKAAGARVVLRKFDDEKSQRTFSVKEIKFKHSWVYNPDADEMTPPELRDEMLAVVSDRSRLEVAYRVRFKNMFMGKWVRYSSLYPTWVVRLFRPDCMNFERSINLAYCARGPEGRLLSHFVHYSFNRGLDAWFDKHNRYSSSEAIETLRSLRSGTFRFGDLLTRDRVRRRRALKELSFRLPARPLLRFFYMYVLKRGFLDGMAGFRYCCLLAIYEYMITIKVVEAKRREAGLPV